MGAPLKPKDLAAQLHLLRPHIRRLLPPRFHHSAGHFGRWLARTIENYALETPVGRPALLPTLPHIVGNTKEVPIVLVNASLAAGGAERQVVNLLRGLSGRGTRSLLLTLHLNE